MQRINYETVDSDVKAYFNLFDIKFFFQDEKKQIITTSVWVKEVSRQHRLKNDADVEELYVAFVTEVIRQVAEIDAIVNEVRR